MDSRMGKTLRELITASKFAAVGLAATAIHVFMVWLLMDIFSLPPFLANTPAFLTAFGFSYMGHYHWSFKAQPRQGNSFRRFILIAGSAFLLNNVLLVYMLEKAYFSEMVSVIVSIFIIPLYTFTGSRFWAFK